MVTIGIGILKWKIKTKLGKMMPNEVKLGIVDKTKLN